MHKHPTTGVPTEAPAAVQKAKNLIEDFFGLTVADTRFMPAKENTSLTDTGKDHFTCDLLSPTGKQLFEFTLTVRPSDGWVTISGHFNWVDGLQVAIDNFVNKPSGDGLVLGDWKPTPGRLEVERADPPEAPFRLD